MLKLLLNANLSHLTKEFLKKTFGYDVITTQDVELSQAKDQQVVAFAQKEGRIIITLDLDFGEIYFLSNSKGLGVIVLRLETQTVEAVNKVLEQFFRSGVIEKYPHSLIIVDGKRYRVRMKGDMKSKK